jgi:hypothetical protein
VIIHAALNERVLALLWLERGTGGCPVIVAISPSPSSASPRAGNASVRLRRPEGFQLGVHITFSIASPSILSYPRDASA